LTPIVYAHRGASAVAPENTVEAFALARSLGADGVELDVRRCLDASLVLHHDAALPDGRIIVETGRLDLPDTLPDLAVALDVCTDMVVNIEIKNSPEEPDFDPDRAVVDAVVALLDERGRRDRVIVSCFHLETIDRVKALDPAIATGYLTTIAPMPTEGIALAVERGHDAIHPHHLTVDQALVDLAGSAGLALNTWTVDDPDRIRQLAEMGVDGICTNVPDVAREVLGPPAAGITPG
jgi:glycerophosphoryl diester phosphodiesterase